MLLQRQQISQAQGYTEQALHNFLLAVQNQKLAECIENQVITNHRCNQVSTLPGRFSVNHNVHVLHLVHNHKNCHHSFDSSCEYLAVDLADHPDLVPD